MNIIKFQDIILDETSAPQLTQEQRDLFNTKFRGKYTYAVDWVYVIALDDMSEQECIQLSQDIVGGVIEIPYDYLSLVDVIGYMDAEATDRSNRVNKYKSYNNFIPDTKIDIDDLKLFRRWLASTLLEMNEDARVYDDKTTQMLTYYKKDMYDDIVNQLLNFQVIDNKIIFTQTSTCNCTPVIGTQLSTGSICDPVALYRQGVYEFMVKTFSNIDFWKDLDVEFLQEFKAYIEGIIGYNLPLYTSEYISEFADCSCVNVSNTAQELLQRILKNLAASLQYMIDDKVDGHKNFIADSLREWSSKLYEKMQWA